MLDLHKTTSIVPKSGTDQRETHQPRPTNSWPQNLGVIRIEEHLDVRIEKQQLHKKFIRLFT